MTNNLMFDDQQFKLGFFSANCSSGMAVTKAPERWVNSWENNAKLAQLADEAGLDFLLPIARWVGYGGATDFHGSVLETMTWAAGLLASTKRISVISTTHTAFNHPVVVAKQIATLDQIGAGRAGLNIVAGWNKPEYDAMGIDLPEDHPSRYGYAEEWYQIVRKLWTEKEPFDWNGERFNLRGVYSEPKPVNGVPPIVNAAGSGEGREFAIRNANFLFTPAIDLARSKDEVAELKAQAKAAGKDVEVVTFGMCVCRPTQAEADKYLEYYAKENADWEAVDNLIALQFAHAQSFPHDLMALIRDRFAAGHGGYPLVGPPTKVADTIEEIYDAGFGGMTLAFVDYVKEFPYFRDEVLPILEKRKIRKKVKLKKSGGGGFFSFR